MVPRPGCFAEITVRQWRNFVKLSREDAQWKRTLTWPLHGPEFTNSEDGAHRFNTVFLVLNIWWEVINICSLWSCSVPQSLVRQEIDLGIAPMVSLECRLFHS
jgi:hypothetical protein